MKNKKAKPILKKIGACHESIDWIGNRTIEQAWSECKRLDWMLWILDKIGYNNDTALRTIACRFVRETRVDDNLTVWDLLTDQRSRDVIEVVERHIAGDATNKELTAARDAAWDAARAAARSAAWAAWAAARAAASDAASDAARKQQADIIREEIKLDDVVKALEAKI